MPEMEKGRPPENKRSRKPAHPVKREINQEMKTFAESTMNELLGWYGYDKVDLRESEANEIRNYRERRQHVSVLKENSLPKPKILDSKMSHSVLAMKSGERESSSVPSSSPSSSSTSSSLTPKEHKSAPVIVPLIKPSAVEDVQNVQIVCVWCQKEGVKRYSLCMGSELKSFCSEKCFAACRRAYFKRNKARDEDLHSDRSPQHTHPEDSPRLVLKINSSVRVCDWCKHVRHTKEYLDFGSGEERLQFCSTKCLNQYKMDVFYREARAALNSTSSSPSRPSQDRRVDSSVAGQKLLTPESWNSNNITGEIRNMSLSPKGPAPMHGSVESTRNPNSEESSFSSKVPVSGLRTLERSIQPPPPLPAVEVSHPHPLPPPRPPLDQKPVPQIPIPFIRPPLHAQGLKSPLANHPRHPAPPSSPIHRPPHSPHMQPPSSASINPPGLMPPFPGAYFPGLHSPPMNMMPRGPVPIPPMMNFGFPTFSPLLPQPTVLVPYPIIVPLPVPIPIPIPIPVPAKAAVEIPCHSGVIQPVPEGVDRSRSRTTRVSSPGVSERDCRLIIEKMDGAFSQGVTSPNESNLRDRDWVKSERPFLSPASTPQSGASSPRTQYNESPCHAAGSDGLPDPTQHQTVRQVIQRVLQHTKPEPNVNGMMDLSGSDNSAVGQAKRTDLQDIIRATHPLQVSPLQDAVCQEHDSHSPPSQGPPSPIGTSNSYDANFSALTSQDHGKNGVSSSSMPPSMDSSLPQRLPASPQDPSLSELEAIKENKCSVVSPVRIEGQPSQLEGPVTVVGDAGEDARVPDEDHAYALPTAPKTGVTTTPLLLPKLRDKGSLRSPTNIPSAGDMEPALKRRCLRIRDQNK